MVLENMAIYRHNIGMEIDYKGIGNRIRERRVYLGFSQEELAFECNLSVPYISQVENGHKSISLNALLQVADVIDCTLDWLVFGADSLYTGFSEFDFTLPIENCTPAEQQYLYDLLSINIKMLKSQRNKASD